MFLFVYACVLLCVQVWSCSGIHVDVRGQFWHLVLPFYLGLRQGRLFLSLSYILWAFWSMNPSVILLAPSSVFPWECWNLQIYLSPWPAFDLASRDMNSGGKACTASTFTYGAIFPAPVLFVILVWVWSSFSISGAFVLGLPQTHHSPQILQWLLFIVNSKAEWCLW